MPHLGNGRGDSWRNCVAKHLKAISQARLALGQPPASCVIQQDKHDLADLGKSPAIGHSEKEEPCHLWWRCLCPKSVTLATSLSLSLRPSRLYQRAKIVIAVKPRKVIELLSALSSIPAPAASLNGKPENITSTNHVPIKRRILCISLLVLWSIWILASWQFGYRRGTTF